MIFDVSTKVSDLFSHKKASEIFDGLFPGLGQVAVGNEQASRLSVEQLVRYSRIPDAEALLRRLQASLQELNEGELYVSPEEQILVDRFHLLAKQMPQPAVPHRQDAIYPGQVWLDTNGRRIFAHGASVYYEDGVYYWYGENKEFTDGKNGVWSWGIRIYRSEDLCNWEDLGLLIPPDIDNPNAPLFPSKCIDRPRIIRNPKTGKYLCWIKLSGSAAAFTVWQADSLLGPYTCVELYYRPGGCKAGDYDLAVDQKTGKGYIYFEADHRTVVCMSLSEDMLHAEQVLQESYQGLLPPFTREGLCLFEAWGKKYMLSSGMTGYVPNRSDCAVSESWEQEFISLGDPHVADPSCASFNSQISDVFQVAGKENVFIAMADRWMPDYPVDENIADMFIRAVGSTFDPKRFQATEEERRQMQKYSVPERVNTSVADFVWLPITWDGEKPRIHWHDSWKPESL